MGHDVRVHLTQQAGELTTICSDDTLNVDCVTVMGGDGSLNEAVAGVLKRSQRDVSLALIPAGTANVLALDMGIPRRTRPIIEMLGQGTIGELHFGLIDKKPFVLMASAGFDAEIVHAVSLPLKRRTGKLAYVLAALKVLARRSRYRLSVMADNQELQLGLAVITSASKYGGNFTLCPDASPHERQLYLVGLEKDGWLARIRFGRGLATGRLTDLPGVICRPVESVSISGLASTPCQVDGDPFGTIPIEVTTPSAPVPFVLP